LILQVSDNLDISEIQTFASLRNQSGKEKSISIDLQWKRNDFGFFKKCAVAQMFVRIVLLPVSLTNMFNRKAIM